jgi:hypothetical protein
MDTIAHVVELELDQPVDEDLVDTIMEDLARHHVTVTGIGDPEHLQIILTLDEPDLLKALRTGHRLAARHGTVIAAAAIPEHLRDQREDLVADPLSQVIGAPDAARMLGISGAAVRALAAKGKIVGTRLNGRAWSLDLASVMDCKQRRGA